MCALCAVEGDSPELSQQPLLYLHLSRGAWQPKQVQTTPILIKENARLTIEMFEHKMQNHLSMNTAEWLMNLSTTHGTQILQCDIFCKTKLDIAKLFE